MSSETSTSSVAKPSGESSDALQPWQLFTLAGLIGATIVVFMSRGQTPAGIILLSLIIFAAAYVGLAALRTFLPLAGVVVDSTAELLGGRTRAALEREKTLVLRSIKELEFDRGMGKVSEKDFAEMSARLRARAARLMRQLDAGSVYREQIEREVARRLGGRDSGPGTRDTGRRGPAMRTPGAGVDIPRSRLATEHVAHETEPAGSGALDVQPGVANPASQAMDLQSRIQDQESRIPNPEFRLPSCASCGTPNDPDARFCKNCGARMERSS